MPDGVLVTPAVGRDSPAADQSTEPITYPLVLTDEGGGWLYVCCLSYLDAVPAALASSQAELVGCRATRTLCLISKLPYLRTAEQILRRLHAAVFFLGPSAPVADLVAGLLRLPCPAALGREVRFHFEGRAMAVLPPDVTGVPRGGELPLRPLLRVLSPVNVLTAFMAVLLEVRVVVISGQLQLPALATEALRLLLWPIRYQHVYVPLVPAPLLDLLDAPTPFLMGVGGAEGARLGAELAGVGTASVAEAAGETAGGLAGRVKEGLVVVDLDRDWVYNCADLRPCLDHPAVTQLVACLVELTRVAPLSPYDMPGSGGPGGRSSGLSELEVSELRSQGSAPAWAAAVSAAAAAAAAVAVGCHGGGGGLHDAGARDGVAGVDVQAAAGSWIRAARHSDSTGGSSAPQPDPWMASVRNAAAMEWRPNHDALVRRLFLRLMAVMLRGCHVRLPPAGDDPSRAPNGSFAGVCSASGPPAGPSSGEGGRQGIGSSAAGCGSGNPAEASARSRLSPAAPLFRSELMLRRHIGEHGPKARPLLEQLLQTQGFLALLDAYGAQPDPYAWFSTASEAWRSEVAVFQPGADSGVSPLAQTPPPQPLLSAAVAAATGVGTVSDTSRADASGTMPAAAVEPADEVPVIVLGAAADVSKGVAAHKGPAAAVSGNSPQVHGLSSSGCCGGNDGNGCEDDSDGRTAWLEFARPCPLLLRRRNKPVYRTFPALHVSDRATETVHSCSCGLESCPPVSSWPPSCHAVARPAVGGNGAIAAGWQHWRWRLHDPASTSAPSVGCGARPSSCCGCSGSGDGDGRGVGGGGAIGPEGETTGNHGGRSHVAPTHRHPAASRRTRSLSGSIGEDLVSLLGEQFICPRA